MGINDAEVIEVLGQENWDFLLENVSSGIINAQHLADVSAQLHKTVGGNHLRRVQDMKKPSDESELRNILSDWWNHELFNLDQTAALRRLVSIFESPSVYLPPVAANLRPGCDELREDTTSNLDSVINSLPEMFKSEPQIAQRLIEIFKSIEVKKVASAKAPREAYKSIDEFFSVMIKTYESNKSYAKEIMEKVEDETEGCFLLPAVETFILGKKTKGGNISSDVKVSIFNKRLKDVKDARHKYLIMQVLEDPINQRRVKNAVSEHKKDISAFDVLGEKLTLLEKSKAEEVKRRQERDNALASLSRERKEKEAAEKLVSNELKKKDEMEKQKMKELEELKGESKSVKEAFVSKLEEKEKRIQLLKEQIKKMRDVQPDEMKKSTSSEEVVLNDTVTKILQTNNLSHLSSLFANKSLEVSNISEMGHAGLLRVGVKKWTERNSLLRAAQDHLDPKHLDKHEEGEDVKPEQSERL